jgi:S-adenosylmethionine/arginine decarboxylase-like enzyme
MCGHADPHATIAVLETAFKPDRTVVKEHLRANSASERTWEIAAAKRPPMRSSKAKKAA